MTTLSFRHLLDSKQITESDIKNIFELAEKYRHAGNAKNYADGDAAGLILATLFFEASTRTRFSFETAMHRLRGNVISLEQGASSSVKKGESLSDTGRIVSNYCDVIVVRHPEIGSAAELAKHATVPVINAGDGANQHPTQSLIDLYTIFCEKKTTNNLRIGMLGDLKYSRAIHSIMELLSRYSGNHFTLISPPSLALDRAKKEQFEAYGCKIEESSDLETSIKDLDVLYATRVQEERFPDRMEYEKVKNCYRIDKQLLSKAKESLAVMHPLPRINEIDYEIDDLPQARYFVQANYAVYIRMALLYLMTRS